MTNRQPKAIAAFAIVESRKETTMSLLTEIRQRIDWHRAELDPRTRNRQEKRARYDEKYGKCPHGTHDKAECDG